MSKSLCDSAIDAAGNRAWILRAARDASLSGADLAFVLRNVRCDAMRAAIAAMPTDGGAIKVPTARAAVLTLLADVVIHLRAQGFVSIASLAS